MNKQESLRYLMLERSPDNPSKRYGKFPIARANTAWNCAHQLCDGDESKITEEVLSEIMDAVERGDNILEYFVSGKYAASGLMKTAETSSGP